MSGIFTLVSTVLMSVIGDSSQNNWFGGQPRGPVTYPNGPASPPALGAPLAGDALARAGEQMDYYQARIWWLGNEQLAAKYGTAEAPELTEVEQEMWDRQVAVLQYTMTRINELAPLEPPVPLMRKPPAQAKSETPVPQAKPEPPVPQSKPEPPRRGDSLADRYRAASQEERAELLKAILAG